MPVIISLLLFPVLWLWGGAAFNILYAGRKRVVVFWEEKILTGSILLIGLAEGAHLGAMVLGRSVSVVQKLFAIGGGGLLILSLLVLALASHGTKKNSSRQGGDASAGRLGEQTGGWRRFLQTGRTPGEVVCLTVFLLVVCWQIFQICGSTRVFLDYDITLETVVTNLRSGKLFELDPLTGQPYGAGMPSRLKVLSLSSLYTALCGISGVSPETMVWHGVPVVTLLLSYLAYHSLGRALFGENAFQRSLFLLLVGILFLVGDTGYTMDGFGLMHAGFRGTTIRNTILIPYTFSLCLQGKWRLLLAVILAEACLVWTLYGAGACLAVSTVMLLLAAALRKIKNPGAGDGEEGLQV